MQTFWHMTADIQRVAIDFQFYNDPLQLQYDRLLFQSNQNLAP